MKIIYSDQEPVFDDFCIFLAGPTPRKKEVLSWRPDAIKILEELNFNGIVFVPERKETITNFDYINQVNWEENCLHNCHKIVFWVPRNMETMPGLTTNVEFGYWMAKDPNKVLYGRPENSSNTRYLDWLYKKSKNSEVSDSLNSLLERLKNENLVNW